METIDTHAHLDQVEDLDGALGRADEAGLSAIVAVGMDLESNKRTLEISEPYGNLRVFPALGIHPWSVDEAQLKKTLLFIEGNIQRALAIGEIGLDFLIKGTRQEGALRKLQREAFQRLLELSRRYNKPALIHARGALEECIEMVMAAGVSKANFHWFSGPQKILKKILDLGFFISATPSAAYSKEHRDAIARTPLDNLLLETDSPVTHRHEKAEPAHLLRTLKAVAEIKEMEVEEVAHRTTENAMRFFDLP